MHTTSIYHCAHINTYLHTITYIKIHAQTEHIHTNAHITPPCTYTHVTPLPPARYTDANELRELNYQRGQTRDKKNARPEKLKYVDHMDLLNFMREHALPESVDLMEDGKMYAVDRLADIWERFPNTTAMALVMKRNIEWIGQLLKTRWSWALHGDGKHKVHQFL